MVTVNMGGRAFGNLPLQNVVDMQVLQFVHGIVAPLADVPVAELALQIYLQAAFSASEVAHLEMIAYEFMEQVCVLSCTVV